MCSDLYAHFLYKLGENGYYPKGAPSISDNRLFAMFHSNTPEHNKHVVLQSMVKSDGVVRVVFATTALVLTLLGYIPLYIMELLGVLMITSKKVDVLGEMENSQLLRYTGYLWMLH